MPNNGKSKKFHLKFDDQTSARLDRLCTTLGCPKSEAIRRAFQYLDFIFDEQTLTEKFLLHSMDCKIIDISDATSKYIELPEFIAKSIEDKKRILKTSQSNTVALALILFEKAINESNKLLKTQGKIKLTIDPELIHA